MMIHVGHDGHGDDPFSSDHCIDVDEEEEEEEDAAAADDDDDDEEE